MEKWVGYNVSVECGSPLGVYQGSILAADRGSITLTRAFRNGFPYPEPRLTIKATDIQNLKIIEPRQDDQNAGTRSTVAATKPAKKTHRSTVSENLQNAGSHANVSKPQPQPSTSYSRNTGNGLPAPAAPRSKPIDIQGRPNIINGAGGSLNHSTPNKGRQRRRNEAFLDTPGDDPAMQQEFDFEKNLALFDKRAIWQQLKNSHKPDLLRQTDQAVGNFKHDENVLSSSPAVYRAINVPVGMRGDVEYVTDEGTVVPSVTAHMRRELWSSLQNIGLLETASILLAKSAVDIALRLLGGERRFDPRNAHQTPTVVVLVGAHKEGQAGMYCAQWLASHGVNTVVHISGHEPHAPLLPQLAQYRMCGQPNCVVRSVGDLPTADLIMVALASHSHADSVSYGEAAEWTMRSRATVMALDPPANGTAGIVAKVSVLAGLPLAHSRDNGQLYLANVSIPTLLFTELGVKYRPPFGAKSHVAIHPADE